jgi:hypothetical protein
MTINSLNLNTSVPVVGLGTQTLNIPTAGLYTASCRYTIPYRAAGTSYDSASLVGQSSLQILIKLNGTTKLTLGGTATSPTPTQGSLGGSVILQCAADDVITFVPSSAAAVDNELNAIKGIINVFAGE